MLRTIDTPIGPLLLTADADGLSRVDFVPVQSGHNVAVQSGRNEACKVHSSQSGEENGGTDKRGAEILDATEAQLAEYFVGRRRAFELPLDPPETTAFRAAVHALLAEIGYGETVTYRDVAKMLGRPGATRAVGSACGANPLLIVRPCHRVLRSDGGLGGYAGGLDAKRFLLTLEEN